jgi:rhodanese-related sulfurtransferase/ABC-type phosphate/phosphonate transport system substrate-binding protein
MKRNPSLASLLAACTVGAFGALTAAMPAKAAEPLSVLINPGDVGEQSRSSRYQLLAAAVNDAVRSARAGDTKPTLSFDATADLAATRAQMHDVYVAPAHVVSSALGNGYVPLAGNPAAVQAVLVSLADRRIGDLATARGTRLGLPLQDSVVTYLVRGELNAANSSLKSHFRRIAHMRYQDALLTCLKIRECDVVGVERATFERWKSAGEPVAALLESRPVPGITVAVRASLASSAAFRELQPALLRTLAQPAVAAGGVDKPAAIARKDYEYVGTLGYFTPRALPGATVVDAAAAAKLLAEGGQYYDVRTEAEFQRAHIAGAKLLPYVEKSPKDTDYDAQLDSFDVSKLPAAKDTPLVFACNGAECWKSYKASQAAVRAGYTRVHWFRGGLPEWRAAQRPVTTAAAPAAK